MDDKLVLYEVALRAVSEERELRHASVADFKAAWDHAIKYVD
ncbi:hypothetical protein [Paenibacillus assamensis]|nr:hypothetical protein [Paenibacillus assamensis]